MAKDVKIFNLCDHYTGGKQYIVERCPKCLGNGYYYDIAFDNSGQAVLATGTIKLQQEMLKIINDVKGNNLFFPRWGSELHGFIGQKATKLDNAKMQLMITTSLEYLRFLQCEESDTYRNMSTDEILLGVESMNIVNYVVGYDVSVTIKNNSNSILTQTILL